MKILRIAGSNLASLGEPFEVDFESEPLASAGVFAIGGPTGAFIVIIYGIVQKYGYDGLVIATIMALPMFLLGFWFVRSGVITRGSKVRFLRDGTIIWKGDIASLKRFKDDAREVREGFECGIGLGSFNDIKVGDVVETFEMREKPRA